MSFSHDLATRWMTARMAFLRKMGLQPGEEPQAARMERIRADVARRAGQPKTYRELILDLENATKRLANTKGWSPELLNRQLGRIEHMREILKDHLDQVPTTKDKDVATMFRKTQEKIATLP